MKYRYREPHEMKYSGVEWLGMIPREWEISKLKYVTTKIIDGAHFTPTYVEEGIPFLRVTDITDIKNNKIDFSKLKFIPEKEHKELIKRCNPQKGDLLVSKNGTIGVPKVIDWDWDFSIFVSLCLIKVKKDFLLPKILFYLFKSNLFDEQIAISGKKTSIINLHLEKIREFDLPILKLQDQQKIADFLDLKCGEFDSIIEKKESLITKLEEAKKSLISEVVTGKVKVIEKEDGSYEVMQREPHEMKDSAVEWLGMIPMEWEVKKIKHLSNIGRGASPRPIDDPKYFDENGEYAWTRIADVTSSGKYLLETTQKMSKLGASLSIKLEPGNIFISIAGSVGKPCITKIKACIHDGFIYFHNLDKKYYNLLYHIFTIGQCYAGLGKLGTQLNLNRETIGNILITLPTDNSEERISDYIDLKCSQFDSTIEKQKELIEKLKKAKQSLISEAVTGKIEVL